MKKLIFTSSLFLICFSSSFAQFHSQGVSGTGVLTFYKNNSDKKANITGSEYIEEDFKAAKVNGGSQPFQIRFNAHTNVMEYKKDNEDLILIKKDNTLIEFTNGKTYELVSYKDKKGNISESYLFLIKNVGKVSTYKFEKINFIEGRPAANTYDTGSVPEYKRASDTFFIKIGDKISELPTKSKEYSKMFPGKESQIKEYFNSNKINFKNEADIAKLTTFLNTLL